LSLEVSINKYSFLPTSVDNGIILKHEIIDDIVKLFINLKQINIGSEKVAISYINGSTLLGNKKISDIIVENVNVKPDGLVSQYDLKDENSKLELVICVLGGDRLLESNDPITLDLPSNIINNNSIIHVNVIEKGVHKLKLVDMFGVETEIQNWTHKLNSSTQYQFELDVNILNSGFYLLKLETPMRSKQIKFIIRK